jgi:hypothetical protein
VVDIGQARDIPQLSLAEHLRRASIDRRHQRELEAALLRSTIYVAGWADAPLGIAVSKPAGEPIDLESWQRLTDGAIVIPFYTSVEAAEAARGTRASLMAMPSQVFLKLTRGTPVVLNPTLEAELQLEPDHVENLLRTGFSNPTWEKVTLDKRAPIEYPVVYSGAQIDALTQLFQQRPAVKNAYLVGTE